MDVYLPLCYILPVNYPLEGRSRILGLTHFEAHFSEELLLEPMRAEFRTRAASE
jgi:hypothetical protein